MTAGEAIIEFVKKNKYKQQELLLHYIQNLFNKNAFLVFKKPWLQLKLIFKIWGFTAASYVYTW